MKSIIKSFLKPFERKIKADKSNGTEFTVSLHPLFFAFGIYYALIGKIFVFLTVTFSALLHEFGHAHTAMRSGYYLNKLTLMPYGAVISGELKGLKFSDEFLIALSGPLTSFAIAFSTVSLWWFFPDLYPVTELIFQTNLTLCLVNLLPLKPLDGGKMAESALSILLGGKKGGLIFKILGLFASAFLLVSFVLTAVTATDVYGVNFSLLFFSAFLLFGIIEDGKYEPYKKVYLGLSPMVLLRGEKINRRAVSSNITVKKLVSLIDINSYNEFVVVDKNFTITQKNLEEKLPKCNLYSSIAETGLLND